MSAKVDSTSAAEQHHSKPSASSAAPTGSQKPSMFSTKSGFVIPKNKLSGSLVPIFRGAKRHGGTKGNNEEGNKQMQRKTKWGPDMTQEATVRQGKALALQIRVDQITQQLKSRRLEDGITQDLSLVPEDPDHNNTHIDYKSEMLELEWREAIGEILKLNPSYKAPPGFKPLLKEDKVPLPVKDFPRYNFVSLIYGPEGDNQKRLEKETGAKIQVHGIKAESKEKDEIKPSGGSDIQCTYEELYVHVSAETFEKVDAAISIIELLISSVTGNLAAASTATTAASGDNENVIIESKDTITSYTGSTEMESQGTVQPAAGPGESPQVHLNEPASWISAIPSQSMYAPSSNASPHPLTPDLSGPFHLSSPSLNPPSMPSLFGPPSPSVAGFPRNTQNLPSVSFGPQPPRQVLQHLYVSQPNPAQIFMPRTPLMVPPSATPNVAATLPYAAKQPPPAGLMPQIPQPLSSVPPASRPEQQMGEIGISYEINGVPANATVSPGFKMGQIGPPLISPHRLPALHPQTNAVSGHPPLNVPAVQGANSLPPLQAGITPGLSSAGQILSSMPAPGMSGSMSIPPPRQVGLPASSVSGRTPYGTSIGPPILAATKPGNFTFQPLQPPNQSTTRVVSQEQPSGPWTPPQFSMPNQPSNQVFRNTQVHKQMDQPQARSVPLAGNPSANAYAPRQTAFLHANHPSPRTLVPQMSPRSFSPSLPMPNLVSPNHPRALNNVQFPQHYPPNQQFTNNNQSVASGKPVLHPTEQIYDPFSPT